MKRGVRAQLNRKKQEKHTWRGPSHQMTLPSKVEHKEHAAIPRPPSRPSRFRELVDALDRKFGHLYAS